jgi:pimeloyl-ACP methyl ester carboxylesterase
MIDNQMKQIMAISIVVLFIMCLTVLCILSWIGCERAIHPKTEVSQYTLSQFDLAVENIRFKTRDSLTLAGWFIPGTNGSAVILVHGRESTRHEMLPHAYYLNKDGFSVLLYDSRYRGESEGEAVTYGAREKWDIEAAVDYLQVRNEVVPKRIGVQGSSLGAASAILAAAEIPEIKGVIARIPFKSFNGVLYHAYPKLIGLPAFPFAPLTKCFCEIRLGVDFDSVDPSKVIGKISPRPIFLIDELEDDLFPSDSVEVLYEAAGEPKQLWQIPGAGHGKGFETDPEGYSKRALEFWRQTLGNITQEPANRKMKGGP